jgi:hypothetical protein
MSYWISHKSIRSGGGCAYHTDKTCRHVGENHREVPTDHGVVERLHECAYCRGEEPASPDPAVECPYCGATVQKLPAHLPCEETP